MIRMRKFLIACFLVAAGVSARAEDAPGALEFMTICANCHGETGQGDGPLADLLTVAAPDLTQLAARNGGRFPFLETLMVIDGRTGFRAHGDEMPVWGDRFERDAETEVSGITAAMIARGRVLSLVEYLETIQR